MNFEEHTKAATRDVLEEKVFLKKTRRKTPVSESFV